MPPADDAPHPDHPDDATHHARKRPPPRPVTNDGDDEEPMGGDPACWLHLFEDDEQEGGAR